MFDTYWYDYADCNDIKELIAKAIASSRTEYIWLRHRAVDYTNFNLRFIPPRHQSNMLHAWASHDNPKCYTTWLIPIENYGEIFYHDGILPIVQQPTWTTSEQVLYDGFNFNWYPDVWDWDKQHHFAMDGTTQLSYTSVGNGNEVKYHISNLRFKSIGVWYDTDIIDDSPYEWNWIADNRIDYTDFNWNWLPDRWDADKIHEFCMWGAEQLSYTRLMRRNCKKEKVYHSSYLTFKNIPKLHQLESIDSEWIWIIDERIDYSNFNFNWLPPAWDINKTHAFVMSGTTQLAYTFLHNTKHASKQIKYHITDLKFDATKQNDEWVWETDERIDYSHFDFDWLPDAWDANKTHAFAMHGTEQLCYTFLRNTKVESVETKYHKTDLRFKSDIENDEWVWIKDDRIDYSDFDFDWLPDAWDADKTHVFCMAGTKHLGYTKLINTNIKNPKIIYHSSNLKFLPQVRPVIYWQDYTNSFNLETFKSLAMGSEWTWIADRRIDYSDWDFDWLPDGWDTNYIHCFTMKDKEQLSYTILIHRDAITNFVDYKYHTAQLQFNDTHADMCLINTNSFDNTITQDFQVRLITTMEEAIKAAVAKSKREWLWLYSDCCEYDGFDWSWLPDLDQREQVHCWPSGTCEKGDTFLIHVPSFNPNKIKYNFEHSAVIRKKWTLVNYKEDNLAQALQYKSSAIYTIFCKETIGNIPDVCLWDKRPIISLNNSNSSSLVPRDCIVKKEIYEYPHLMKISEDIKTQYDIVFISYDEVQADENYVKLLESYPHAKRVHGVEGMENALAAAAKCSNTDYFYAVFAKTKLYESWDFTTEPDYWRDPRNYIFYAINTSNDLVYGEMGIVLYNKKFLLTAPSYDELGIDFTMSFPVQVIPQISAYGEFATDPYRAWRTAFRETCKLAYFNSQKSCIETQYRINQWKTYAHGEHAEDVLRGANDGYQYFIENSDDLSALKKTFRWDWLKNYYNSKYN